jgi:hypothetical protein
LAFVSVSRLNDDADALQVDLYLESLLAARARQPRLVEGLGLDADEHAAAELLAARFVRFHPSFRFEEALAARLRSQAGERRVPSAVTRLPTAVALDPDDHSARTRRRVLIGGAIASGVSLAGAALFAWRATSAPRTPFGRAARAVHRGRPAALRKGA